MSPLDAYLETGEKRIIAGALDWPGWCRSGRDERSALQALVDYAPRYAQVLSNSRISFQAPANPSAFTITERLAGNATTDFGAPAIPPAADRIPIQQPDLERFEIILQACWQGFDRAVEQAGGKELRKGPRGGGRELDQIAEHVLEAEQAYLQRVSWKFKITAESNLWDAIKNTRQAVLSALAAAAKNGLPEHGPRGGVIWPARYFVRRVAWHVLDHAWEIEDRAS